MADELTDMGVVVRTPGGPEALEWTSLDTAEPGRGIPDVGLGDTLPDPTNVPAGCRFHPRCPRVMEVCRTVPPPRVTARERSVECHLFV